MNNQELFLHAKDRFPGGGTQLLSKNPALAAPGVWPPYYREAHGCELVDYDGRRFYDFSTCGIGACLLGYAHPEVSEAVMKAVRSGSMTTLNSYEEVELADRLCEIHPWAEQVRFARTGGETAAIAVRIARSTTDKSLVAVCGYHGWSDWYIACNLGSDDESMGKLLPGMNPWGVPRELRGTTLTFNFDDFAGFDRLMAEYGDRLAAIVMEPARHDDPAPGFLEHIRSECTRRGILLIFDEITSGWRFVFGGLHLKYKVVPDMALFAKALGNGHPIGAVIGTRNAMQGAERAFISSTYWTERCGSVAALATLAVMERSNVAEVVNRNGGEFMRRMLKLAEKHGVPLKFHGSFGALIKPEFSGEKGRELGTLMTQLFIDRGFLHAVTGFYPTLAHTQEIMEKFYAAADEVFAEMAGAIAENRVEEALRTSGNTASGFKRLN